jgi:transposase
LFGWREFANRRELAGCVGLAPTPYASGGSEIEQGMSKAGNRRVRALLVEQAWKWLQLQPDSALTQWFNRRFASGGRRMRRVGIVALARRLVIALWRYLKHGEIPAGAVLKPVVVLRGQTPLRFMAWQVTHQHHERRSTRPKSQRVTTE